MKTTKELKELFVSGEKDELLRDIYIDEALLDYQRQRYADATRTIRMEKCWPLPSIWTPSES